MQFLKDKTMIFSLSLSAISQVYVCNRTLLDAHILKVIPGSRIMHDFMHLVLLINGYGTHCLLKKKKQQTNKQDKQTKTPHTLRRGFKKLKRYTL